MMGYQILSILQGLLDTFNISLFINWLFSSVDVFD